MDCTRTAEERTAKNSISQETAKIIHSISVVHTLRDNVMNFNMAKPSFGHNHRNATQVCRRKLHSSLLYYLSYCREQICNLQHFPAIWHLHFQTSTKAKGNNFEDAHNLPSATESKIFQLQTPSLSKQQNKKDTGNLSRLIFGNFEKTIGHQQISVCLAPHIIWKNY